jgi:hypothetical protein
MSRAGLIEEILETMKGNSVRRKKKGQTLNVRLVVDKAKIENC